MGGMVGETIIFYCTVLFLTHFHPSSGQFTEGQGEGHMCC